MIWRARRHVDDAGCHQDGYSGKDAAADPPPGQPGHEMKQNRDGQPGGAHHQAATAGSRGCPVRGIAGLASQTAPRLVRKTRVGHWADLPWIAIHELCPVLLPRAAWHPVTTRHQYPEHAY